MGRSTEEKFARSIKSRGLLASQLEGSMKCWVDLTETGHGNKGLPDGWIDGWINGLMGG